MGHESNFKLYYGPPIDGLLGVLLMIGWQKDHTDERTITFDTHVIMPGIPPESVPDMPLRECRSRFGDRYLSRIVPERVRFALRKSVEPSDRERSSGLFLCTFEDGMRIDELCWYYGNADSTMRSQFHSVEENTYCESLRDCLLRLRENIIVH